MNKKKTNTENILLTSLIFYRKFNFFTLNEIKFKPILKV